jgi:hypothetical protein
MRLLATGAVLAKENERARYGLYIVRATQLGGGLRALDKKPPQPSVRFSGTYVTEHRLLFSQAHTTARSQLRASTANGL